MMLKKQAQGYDTKFFKNDNNNMVRFLAAANEAGVLQEFAKLNNLPYSDSYLKRSTIEGWRLASEFVRDLQSRSDEPLTYDSVMTLLQKTQGAVASATEDRVKSEISSGKESLEANTKAIQNIKTNLVDPVLNIHNTIKQWIPFISKNADTYVSSIRNKSQFNNQDTMQKINTYLGYVFNIEQHLNAFIKDPKNQQVYSDQIIYNITTHINFYKDQLEKLLKEVNLMSATAASGQTDAGAQSTASQIKTYLQQLDGKLNQLPALDLSDANKIFSKTYIDTFSKLAPNITTYLGQQGTEEKKASMKFNKLLKLASHFHDKCNKYCRDGQMYTEDHMQADD